MFAGVVSRLTSTMSSSHSMPPAAAVVMTFVRMVVVLVAPVLVHVVPVLFSVLVAAGLGDQV